MTDDDIKPDVRALMKRCQIGCGGRNALDDAHSIMAECYGMLGRLALDLAAAERERQQPAPSAEAVAWRYAASYWTRRESVPDRLFDKATPLYAAPQPALPPEVVQAMRGALDALRETMSEIDVGTARWRRVGQAADALRAALGEPKR